MILFLTKWTDIEVASGQEQHLPHEAWHVVQQKQGRVKSTANVNGTAINDDVNLEKEADTLGKESLNQGKALNRTSTTQIKKPIQTKTVQRVLDIEQILAFIDKNNDALKKPNSTIIARIMQWNALSQFDDNKLTIKEVLKASQKKPPTNKKKNAPKLPDFMEQRNTFSISLPNEFDRGVLKFNSEDPPSAVFNGTAWISSNFY